MTQEEKEKLIQEIYRTELLTLSSGCESIVLQIPITKLLDVLYILDCYKQGSVTKELERIRTNALFKYIYRE